MANASDGSAQATASWLKAYYLCRAAVAGAWAALAFTVGKSDPTAAGALLVAYPLYDAAANWFDAKATQKTGGLSAQMVNIIVSLACAAGVALALGHGMNAVMAVFGLWAILAGLLQLVAGVRRWKSFGAQWAMILSGGQSALVGGLFISRASADKVPTIADIAPYAIVGAIYFLVSGVWLFFRSGIRRTA